MRGIILGAIAAGLALLLSAVATAQSSQPSGTLLVEIPRKCSQSQLTVWGDEQDLTLAPGQTSWTYVNNRRITLFCGSYEDEVECPRRTDFVWVSRTGRSDVFIACYERD